MVFSKTIYWLGLYFNTTHTVNLDKPKESFSHYEKIANAFREKDISVKYVSMKEVYENPKKFRRLFGIKDTSYVVTESVHNNDHMAVFYNCCPKEKRVFNPCESPIWTPQFYTNETLSNFAKVITWKNDLIDNVKIFKFYHYRDCYLNSLCRPMIDNIVPFDNKKLACFFTGNHSAPYAKDFYFPFELYTLRKNVVSFFSDKSNVFDLYGSRWPRSTPNYKGTCYPKVPYCKNYKFCFALENVRGVSGYLTEKIWDVFVSGCVPIYFGDPDVKKEIPEKCFIDLGEFKNLEELYIYINQMTEQEYNERIYAIREFLKTDVAKKYHIDFFCKTLVEVLSK